MPNPLVELPAVQHGKKHSLSRANTVSDKPKKKQKLETSGASLPASIDPPTSSSSSTGESVTKSACTSISNASIGYRIKFAFCFGLLMLQYLPFS